MKYHKIKNILKKIKYELEKETVETANMLNIYRKATFGEASEQELKFAKKQLKDLLKNIGFSSLLLLPFSPLSIFLLITFSKKFKIDILPQWYKEKDINNWDLIAENYEKSIFSLTKFSRHVDKIIQNIEEPEHVLIIGAGSETYLQESIVKNFPNSKIIISDYSFKMLEKSKGNFNHPNLQFELIDMTKISYKDSFDYIISTNSILLETREMNNEVFKRIKDSLKTNGKFIGFMVSFDSVLNMIKNDQPLKKNLKLNYDNLSIYDSNETQSYHTKESLEENLKNNNLKKEIIEKVFLNKEDEVKELKRLYPSLNEDLIPQTFEYFIIATKKID